jgi:hypothetical protein
MTVCAALAMIYSSVWGLANCIPYSIEYEGHVLWACRTLAQGMNIYAPGALTEIPSSVVIYSPLYFAVGALCIKAFGVGLPLLRAVSMASALVCFFYFGLLLKRCRLSDFHVIIALALFACTVPVLHWSSVARVDFLGLALAVIGMERFCKAWFAPKDRAPTLSPLAVFFLLAAAFTKQQYLVFSLACLIFTCLQKKSRLASNYLLLWTAIAAPALVVIELVSGGFLAHLSYASSLPWHWQTLTLFLCPFLADAHVVAAAAIILAAPLYQHRSSLFGSAKRTTQENQTNQARALAAILLTISLLLALYTMGLRGAYHNHLLCSEFALFWLAALNLPRLPPIASALPIVALSISLQPLLEVGGEFYYRARTCRATSETIKLLRGLPRSQRLILTEDPSLAIFAGAEPALVDATTFLNTSKAHSQTAARLLRDIENRTYGAIIINTHDALEHREQIWPESVVRAIDDNYLASGVSGGNGMEQTVYLPKR